MLTTPPMGRIWVLEAMKMNIKPKKNVGMLIVMNEKRDIPRSNIEYLCVLDIKTRGMVRSHKKIRTTKERYNVFGSLCFIKELTGI